MFPKGGLTRDLSLAKGGLIRIGARVTDLFGTAWRVLYLNGSGSITELALGASGTFLKSNGAAAAPTFAVPPADPTPFIISPASRLSLGSELAAHAIAAPGSAAWPSANLAIYVPFVLAESVTVVKLWWNNGAAVSGNVDVGIYNSSLTRLISAGSTAQATANVLQAADVTDTAMGPGQFYMALACDNTTAEFVRWSVATTPIARGWGMAQQATAFALPDPAVPVVSTSGYLPLFGLSLRTLVA